MIFEEAEGTTYILRKEEAEDAWLDCEFPSRIITLEIHSSLDAVGFFARIATALAKAGIGVNPVSGYFVRLELTDQAMVRYALKSAYRDRTTSVAILSLN